MSGFTGFNGFWCERRALCGLNQNSQSPKFWGFGPFVVTFDGNVMMLEGEVLK